VDNLGNSADPILNPACRWGLYGEDFMADRYIRFDAAEDLILECERARYQTLMFIVIAFCNFLKSFSAGSGDHQS